MELRHLRYFVALAEERHFGRAAERLHIVQPALSMQIRDLETELGTALLIRTSRRVEVTEAGAIFYEEALRVLAQAERAVTVGQRIGRGEIGLIRVGYSENAALAGIVTQALREFRRQYPDAQMELSEVSPFAQAAALLEDQIDVGFTPPFHQNLPEGLTRIPLSDSQWMIGLSSEHPFAAESELGGRDLRNQSFVVCAEPYADEAQAAVLRRLIGQEPKIAIRTPNWITVLTLASAGYGMALVPSSLSSVPIEGVAYRPIRAFKERSHLNLVVRDNEYRPVAIAFISVVRSLIEGKKTV